MRIYYAFVDPSGGSSDSMTLAVGHLSFMQKKAILDGHWERRPPFSPDAVVEEFAAILKSYQISMVTGDRYAGAWVSERFQQHGIRYEASAKTKSEIFNEFVAYLNSGRVKLPANKRLRIQFESLERRSSRTGKDIVDHGIGGHDDAANAAAGALCLALGETANYEGFVEYFPGTPTDGTSLARPDRGSSLGGRRDEIDEDGFRWTSILR